MPSRIFRDKNKLSPRYVPERLPHREKQIENLFSIYGDALEDIEGFLLKVTQVVGDVGTGKTCTVLRFGRIMEEEATKRGINLQHIYINGRLEGTSRFTLYQKILTLAAPAISARSLSPEEMLFHLLRYLNSEGKYLLISFDEIDYFCKRSKEHIVYDLTRLNEVDPTSPCNIIGVIFIARDLSYHSLLEPSELSTLGRGIIEFPRYNSEQIKDILADRVELAFNPGVIDEDVLEFISDVTVRPPINGDVRVALDILLYSGNLAENLGSDMVLPDHVRRVYGEMYPRITSSDVEGLDQHEKALLLGFARTLMASKSPYASLREIIEAYRVTCEEYNIRARGDVEEIIQNLADKGIIEILSLRKIGLLNAPAKNLEIFLDAIMERLRGDLHEGG